MNTYQDQFQSNSPGAQGGADIDLAELQLRNDELERRVYNLEATINRWRLHGLSVLDTQPLFLASGGVNGTSPQAARSDHT